jgi:electron transfer flavoprotein beta subunit
MKVVVCAKLIPDPAAPQALDGKNNLDRSGKLVLDDADTYGIEVALQLVESTREGEVVVVSMASSDDLTGLRSALAMGATRGIVVSDESLRGTDSLGTAKILASVVRSVGPDLILCATESSDGYTGMVPIQLAELLGVPSLTNAKTVVVEESKVKINRQTSSGYQEVVASLPCVVTVTAGAVEPRYASFKGIMASKSKPVEVLSVEELGLASEIGMGGARQEVFATVVSESRKAGQKFLDEGDGAERIVAFLESLNIL